VASNHLVGSSNLSGCTNKQKGPACKSRAFLFVGVFGSSTPQFDKTHRVLDSRQAAPQG